MSSVKKQREVIEILSDVCEELGWVVGICADDPEKLADGLIIGPEDFVQAVLSKFTREMEIFGKNFGDEGMHEKSPSTPVRKKEDMH